MYKKLLTLVLIGLLVNLAGVQFAQASSKEDKQAKATEKVKKGINRLGVGEKAKVEVTLRDKTKLKGYVREAGANSFVVVNSKTGAATEVTYSQVERVNGHNMSTGAQIAIVAAIGGGLVFVLLFILYHGFTPS
jgi:alanine racemase